MKAEKVSTVVDLGHLVQRVKEEAVTYRGEEGPRANINWLRLAGRPQRISEVAGLVIEAIVTEQLTIEGPGRDILRQATIRNPEAAANALVDLLDYRNQQARPLSSGRRDK